VPSADSSATHQTILSRLDELAQLLPGQGPDEPRARAVYQCERLRHAVQHAHSEGVRFAGFTLGRILSEPAHAFSDDVRRKYDELREALEAVGHRL